MQDDVTLRDLRLSSKPTGPDRATVTATYDLDGSRRSRQFFAVKLDGDWKVENVADAGGFSLRRALTCAR